MFSGVAMITHPGKERGEEEVTRHDSDQDDYMEYRPTLINPGSLKIELDYTPAQYARVNAMIESGEVKTWKLTDPGGSPTVYTFKAFLKKLDERTQEKDKQQTFKFEARCTGKPTVSGGS